MKVSEEKFSVILYWNLPTLSIYHKKTQWCCSFFSDRAVPAVPANRGKSPNMGRFPNRGRCIISYQEVLNSLLKNVNDQAHEAILCNQSINGQLLRTTVLIGRLYFGALWNFCLSLKAVEGTLFFCISSVLGSLLSAISNPSCVS